MVQRQQSVMNQLYINARKIRVFQLLLDSCLHLYACAYAIYTYCTIPYAKIHLFLAHHYGDLKSQHRPDIVKGVRYHAWSKQPDYNNGHNPKVNNNERNQRRGGNVQYNILSSRVKPNRRESMQRKRESTKTQKAGMRKRVEWGLDVRGVEF